ncbi:MAG: hypothetical protein FWH35_06855, partial [Treponema sp.]|nr:hypothetical protein [Treponema sp.]
LILYFLRKKLIPETSIFGKIAIAAVMILFVFKPAAIFFAVLKPAAVIIETCVGFIVALSILDKAVFLFTGIMRNLAERK